ncbi:MAG TPA: alpha/beta fold hydrolase [Candidatus Limnocylindrales bacterium]|jgi:pimeloyl-ACP methyl ester carboxylesterase
MMSPHGPVVALEAGDGPPLILLHGLAGSGTWWRRNMAALSAGFRVIAIDLPGFGMSHPDARLVLEEAPAQVAALMAERGIARAHVIGHSMGGLVAGGLAADHPECVDRLVLVDAGFLSLDPAWWHRVTGPLRTLPWTSPSLMLVLLRDMARSGVPRMAGATAALLRIDWGAKLPSIAAPTLVVWGQHDRICAPRIGEQIAEAIPSARLVVIAGSGHNPMWEKSADFDREVLAFLREPPRLSDPR